jgi:hypothetical protein
MVVGIGNGIIVLAAHMPAGRFAGNTINCPSTLHQYYLRFGKVVVVGVT